MHGEGFFFSAFVYLSAAVIAVPLAKRLGLGSVIGYLAAGVAIGPAVFGLVGDGDEGLLHFAEFGVVMMLFLVGLELDPAALWRLRRPMVGLGGSQVLLCAAVLALGATWLGLPWQGAVAVGLTLSLSSTAMVLQTLQERGLARSEAGRSTFAVLLFQDVAVIPMLAIFPLLATLERPGAGGDGHGDADWLAGLPGMVQVGAILGAVLFVGLAGRFLVRPLFHAVARVRLRELLTATSLLLVIGIALLMNGVGLSPALGTFLAGVVLANSEFRHELEVEIEPFKGLLLGLFFISVGASIDFALMAEQPGLIAGVVVALFVVKAVVLYGLGRAFGLGMDQGLLLAALLSQGGEFAFVLFSFASQEGVLAQEDIAPLIVAVAVSMAATPWVLLLLERLVLPRFGTREEVERDADAFHAADPVIIAGFGRFGQITGRLLLANGVGITVLDHDSSQVELVRRLGLEAYYGDASRVELLRAAGAEDARLLIIAIDDPELTLRVAERAKQHFPNLVILARARGRADAYDLVELGLDGVYRDTLDTALRTGADALRHLGIRGIRAHRSALRMRRLEEARFRDLAGERHDHGGYFSRARESIREVEEILKRELQRGALGPERAWDASGRREEDRGEGDGPGLEGDLRSPG